ncbi:MAG TPA: 23S rRNA pseudouridine(2604) synthase RluF [Bacteroidia bacterium]|nr:23S rRNA pseudouridine(2604) synthase RluF [Bacteroidia bacterium]
MRLNKFISESGLCSRREADRYIEQGNVYINGRRAQIGDQVKVGDRVRVNGHELEPRQEEDLIFIALNKPVGITSTTEEGVPDNIVQFVNHSQRIFPVGRLDKDSQGLIFLTNNGDIVNKILRAGNKHEKEYVVTVNLPLTDEVIQGMSRGVPMLGVTTKKCKVVQESAFTFRITLIQGLNRQIRRMCEHFGYDVVKLERVRIMNINLKGLPPGEWRNLTDEEMKELYSLIENSSSEADQNNFRNKEKEKSWSANKRKHSSKKIFDSGKHSNKKNGSTQSSGNTNRNNPDKRNKKRSGSPSGKTSSKGRRR